MSADAFIAAFDRSPEGTWRAPGRVNIIGEHTDYNGGHVLPTSLPFTAGATVARRDDGRVRIGSEQSLVGHVDVLAEHRITELRPGPDNGWAGYALGVAWALHEAGYAVGGADIWVDSEVPMGAGLSSSAALECSVALALRDLFQLDITLPQLALLAQRAENEFVGVPCGIMDQMASLLCVPGEALLLDTRSLETRQLPFALDAAGLVLTVIDTRVRHELGTSEYGNRRRDCEHAAAMLGVEALCDIEPDDLDDTLGRLGDSTLRRRVRHVVTEEARVLEAARLLDRGELRALGAVLTAGHASLRDDFEVSCIELDVAVDTALGAGALGARMVGGGFGGSAIALVEADRAAEVERAVDDAFGDAGFTAPRIFVAAPAPASSST
jgi:galactokinase